MYSKYPSRPKLSVSLLGAALAGSGSHFSTFLEGSPAGGREATPPKNLNQQLSNDELVALINAVHGVNHVCLRPRSRTSSGDDSGADAVTILGLGLGLVPDTVPYQVPRNFGSRFSTFFEIAFYEARWRDSARRCPGFGADVGLCVARRRVN